MRDNDHDCVQSYEDFTYTEQDVEPATPPSTAVEISIDDGGKKRGNQLDGLGGGRLD
ncbi:MAG TPA: hypothetical protein VNV36_00830 [Pseudomonas sp.]|uniref:hypothetical protein n=1 Tax=Pseudomonas sp. TaxID=306 RepID=UPI002B545BEF|nr:hypothetical protein [Pseudomonas sp.]HWH85300.1 hypothetical protein [Pseudomonas sp.]